MTLNQYVYCLNNPGKYVDPSGHWPNWNKMASGIFAAAVGTIAITTAIAAAPGLIAVATMVAGVTAVTMGLADVGESVTGNNIIKEKIFRGNETVYNYVKGGAVLLSAAGAAYLIYGLRMASQIEYNHNWFQKATKPMDYLNEALRRQGLDNAPMKFKEKWSEFGYDFEIRIHSANPEYGKIGSIFRVARRKQGLNALGEGYGWEYMDDAGEWFHKSVLKLQNALYNAEAAKNTHIQLP